jgi:hypothetical protein
MGWYPCECCGACCKASGLSDCPCVCVSRYPCTTTLTISGNHPATLKFPINYLRNPGDGFGGTLFCGLEGEANVDRSASSNHTQLKSWEEQDRFWDHMTRNRAQCCFLDLNDLQNSYVAFPVTDTLKAVQVSSRCYRADLRYEKLDVEIRQDKKLIYGEQVCGITVTATLTLKRFLSEQDHTCIYFYGRTQSATGCGLQIPFDYYVECGQCYINNTLTNSTFNPSNLSTAPYPSMPTGCGPLSDNEWESGTNWDGDNFSFRGPMPSLETNKQIETIYIRRSKFIPGANSIGCTAPFTVSLTPEDTVECLDSQPDNPGVDGYCYEFSYVYCPVDTTEDDTCFISSFECPPGTVPLSDYQKFGVFYGISTVCPDVEVGFTLDFWYVISNASDTGPGCTGSTFAGNPNIPDCIQGSVSFRDRGYTLNYAFQDKTTLFAEGDDTWVLKLECPA